MDEVCTRCGLRILATEARRSASFGPVHVAYDDCISRLRADIEVISKAPAKEGLLRALASQVLFSETKLHVAREAFRKMAEGGRGKRMSEEMFDIAMVALEEIK
jgi:hypothetical protein